MGWPKIALSHGVEVWLPGGDEVDSNLYITTFDNDGEHHYFRSEFVLSPEEKRKLLAVLLEDRDRHTSGV